MKWYKKEKPEREKWYDGSWKSRLLFKARSNSLEVNERRNRWLGEQQYCLKCSRRGDEVTETLEHLIKECPWYEDERREYERSVIERIGDQEWERIREGEEDMEYILGFKPEERGIVEDTKKYLGKLWAKRKEEGRINEEEEQRVDHNYGDL